jgi:allantoin racemase
VPTLAAVDEIFERRSIMKIMVINPNTSDSMTDHIRSQLSKIKRQDTELTVVRPDEGPVSIETGYDESFAIPQMLKLIQKANREGYDAIIIADFGDPGLEVAREISDVLVVGIEETTLHAAAMLGASFTVLTPIQNRIPHKYRDVRKYKLEDGLASVRTTDMSVVDTDADPDRTKKRILEVARQAVEQDGAEVIILGCAAMLGYSEEISRSLGVVVLDPVSVTFKLCEGMVDAKLLHSKKALFAKPKK